MADVRVNIAALATLYSGINIQWSDRNGYGRIRKRISQHSFLSSLRLFSELILHNNLSLHNLQYLPNFGLIRIMLIFQFEKKCSSTTFFQHNEETTSSVALLLWNTTAKDFAVALSIDPLLFTALSISQEVNNLGRMWTLTITVRHINLTNIVRFPKPTLKFFLYLVLPYL